MLTLLMVGVLGLMIKAALLERPQGFGAIARILGRIDANDLSLWEKLAYFRDDLLVNLLALPLLGLAIGRLLPRRAALPALLLTTLGLISSYAIAYESLRNVGRFLTPAMALDAWHWAFAHPENLIDYLTASKWQLSLPILLASLFAWWGAVRDWRLPKVVRTVLSLSAVLICLGSVLLPRKPLPQGRAILVGMAAALLGERRASALPDPLPDEALPRFYRSYTGSLPASPNDPYFGRERGADVLLFVLETGPRRALDLAADSATLPALSRLRTQAFLSSHHYSTYPYTSDALYSILTGSYPLARREFLQRHQRPVQRSLQGALAAQGYRNFVYSPDADAFEADSRMFALLGGSERYIAEHHQPFSPPVRALAAQDMARFPQDSSAFKQFRRFTERRFERDRAMLETLKHDIRRLKQNQQRFSALIMPQLGHAPWLNLNKHATILPRGRDAMLVQMQWLAEIVTLLEQHDWLKNTLIVVTADHGIRTRAEDPAFQGGTVSDYSFNVPLLLYAPNTLSRAQTLTELSSHIDIAPSVLTLLGIAEHRDLEQGMPIWSPQLAGRASYFFAGDYLGADAYYSAPHFYMRDSSTGLAYRERTLNFNNAAPLPADEAAEVNRHIDTLYELAQRSVRLIE